MVFTESAKVLTAQEIKETLEEESGNPTVERLFFLEVKGTEEKPSKVFPIYFESWGEIEENNMKQLVFRGYISQYTRNGGFGMIVVNILEQSLGHTRKIWDKPPTAGLRKDEPWIEDEEEAQ